MKISVVAVGTLKSGPELDLIKNYQKQLSWPLHLVEVSSNRSLSGEALKAFESEKLIAKIPKNSYVIAMDERGKSITSQGFAKLLSEQQINGTSSICFIIGGADGLSNDILKQCNFKLALGSMTWPHKLARAMLVEQIYRAEKILQGHPYHRD